MPEPEGISAEDADVGIVLELHGIGKSFQATRRTVQSLEDVSASVQRGRVTGLIGPDGAGKTTLMRLIAGLLKPDTGHIKVLGMDATEQALMVQEETRYMPQRFGLYEDLTVQENLDLYADLQNVAHGERPERYRELMHMTGLAPFTTRLAEHLSGGMKQKLGLACTLVRPPQLLLLDEPTAGVDPVSRRELWEIVYRQVKQAEMSVIFSTAYLDEAERCHDLLLLHQGRLIGQGKPDEFSARLRGRTYHASADVPKRKLQQQLSRIPGVLDAVIQGEHVRLVTKEGVQPSADWLLGMGNVRIDPVAPRFEDSFVSILGGGDVARELNDDGAHLHGPSGHDDVVIEVQGLKRAFGDFYAVKGIDFHVQRGEVFGLLGANGAGKSTTFRMLCGLLPVSDGHLEVAGVNLRTAAASARSRIGYMSQRFSLYGSLTVDENLRFFSSVYGLSRADRDKRIDWAFERFDLGPVAQTGSDDLSLGYKQRLAMACALLHRPDILFLDEPTSGVDPLARREFWHRINDLAEQGVTVLVTTHFMEEAEYCDRLVIMAEGEILAEGTPQEIKAAVEAQGGHEPTMEDAFIALIEKPERTVPA